MWMIGTLVFTICTAVLFVAVVPLRQLFDAFQPMIVALSIMAAALLVRLNRGMPTLDWKGRPGSRKDVTSKVLSITREYLVILGVAAFLLVGLVALTAARTFVFPVTGSSPWSPFVMQACAGFVGGLSAFCLVRMSYVLWRDYDIMRLQKELLDLVGDQEEAAIQAKAAEEKLKAIQGANLRPVPSVEPRAWNG